MGRFFVKDQADRPCLQLYRSCGRFHCTHGKKNARFPRKPSRVYTQNVLQSLLTANTVTSLELLKQVYYQQLSKEYQGTQKKRGSPCADIHGIPDDGVS